jgi:hypothetical protein
MELFRTARITIFAGAFGSGKTELAANFASRLAGSGGKVSLVDIDIVKPLFRSRELRQRLGERGIKVVSTLTNLEMSDLPALSPEIFGLLGDSRIETIIDVGGDDDGARALGRFRDNLERAGYEMLYVINTRRPFTSTPDEIISMMGAVQEASRLRVTALVANTNLGAESGIDLAREGLPVIGEVSRTTGIPIRFVVLERGAACDREGAARLSEESGLPVFVMDRFMLPPWEGFRQS